MSTTYKIFVKAVEAFIEVTQDLGNLAIRFRQYGLKVFNQCWFMKGCGVPFFCVVPDLQEMWT